MITLGRTFRFLASLFIIVSTLRADTRDTSAAVADNAELKRMYEDDQAARKPAYDGKPIDVLAMSQGDDLRERRVKEMYFGNELKTGADYYHAAMILQHGLEPDDFLLSHDFSVIAIAKGELRAKWLAAASMDRFLTAIGRPQRFGTQFGRARPGFPVRLRPVDPNITDEHRNEFGVRPLAEQLAREATMAKVAEMGRVPIAGEGPPKQTEANDNANKAQSPQPTR